VLERITAIRVVLGRKCPTFCRGIFVRAAWPRIGFVAVPCGPLYQYCDVDACTHWPQAKAPSPMLEMAATLTDFYSQITFNIGY
jgi:hypothetical protein